MTRRAFLTLLGLAPLSVAVTPATAATKITLTGRLYSYHPGSDTPDYALTDDTEWIELRPNDGGYVADYLKGCEGRIVHVTIEPQAEQ